jgi:hypothetical protein
LFCANHPAAVAVRFTAKKNSFQAKMKHISAVAARPGETRTTPRHRPQPVVNARRRLRAAEVIAGVSLPDVRSHPDDLRPES